MCHVGIEIPAVAPTTHDVSAARSGEQTDAMPVPPSTVNDRPGIRQLGRFSILAILGEGAFGTVYKAHDPQLDRIVAIKIPRLDDSLRAMKPERLLREARAAAQLRHPHIVPIFDAGEIDGSYYIASAFIPPGQTLRDRIQSDVRLDERTAAQFIERIALALHYAHTQGIVHRDMKPDNVLLDTADMPHIADFGLARRGEGEAPMTQQGVHMGTPAYMSPEMHEGKSHEADARSDLWALGVMLYEMLTGVRPFRGGDQIQTMVAVVTEAPVPPRKLIDTISKDLEQICLKCLEKDPAGRYANCKQLAEDLARWRQDEPVMARPLTGPERLWRWSKRNRLTAGLTAAVSVSMLCGLIGVTWMWLVANQNRASSEINLKVAKEQHGVAIRERLEALEQKKQAQDNLGEALRQRLRAETNEAALEAAIIKLETERIAAEKARELAEQRKEELQTQKQLAEERLRKLDAAQAEATTAKTDASKQRNLATLARRQSLVSAYANKLRTAAAALKQREFESAQKLLDDCRPKAEEPDVRDFAWEYLTLLANRTAGIETTLQFRAKTLNEQTELGQLRDLQFCIPPQTGQHNNTVGLQALFQNREVKSLLWSLNTDKHRDAGAKRLDPIAGFICQGSGYRGLRTPLLLLAEAPQGGNQLLDFRAALDQPFASGGREIVPTPYPFVTLNGSSQAFFNSTGTDLFTVSTNLKDRIEVTCWDVQAKKINTQWKVDGDLALAFQRNYRTAGHGGLAISVPNQSAEIWPIRLIPQPAGVDLFAIHDGSAIHLLNSKDGKSAGRIETSFRFVGDGINDGVFPDGSRIVLADSHLLVQDLTHPAMTVPLACAARSNGYGDSISQCSISTDATTIFLLDRNLSRKGSKISSHGDVRLFDAETGAEKFWFDDAKVERFAISPIGSLIAVCFIEQSGVRIVARYGDSTIRGAKSLRNAPVTVAAASQPQTLGQAQVQAVDVDPVLRNFLAACPDQEAAMRKAQAAVDEINRRQIGHIIYGRVELLPDRRDPIHVDSQMEILPGGYFVDTVKDLVRPVGFRMHGYEPVDLQLNGKSGELVDVGVISLKRLAPTETSRLTGRFRSMSGTDPRSIRGQLSIDNGPVNTPSNGTEPRSGFDYIKVRVESSGNFSVTGCSPAEYYLLANLAGHVQKLIPIHFNRGEPLDLGEITLEKQIPIRVTYRVADQPPFITARSETAEVKGGTRWRADNKNLGYYDLQFEQENGNIFLVTAYGDVRLADLGPGEISDFADVHPAKFKLEMPSNLPAKTGHVYLLDCPLPSLDHWVLMKIVF